MYSQICGNIANNRAGGRPGGFTLIELLVVVAIISILASIAVPNFLEAQIRAKVGRTIADMSTLRTAIESYRTDHTRYPYRYNSKANITSSKNTYKPWVPDRASRLKQMSVLTTPIAYISSLFQDVFETRIPGPNNIIDYYDPTQTSWLINGSKDNLFRPSRQVSPDVAGWLFVSVGPDGYLGDWSNEFDWPASSQTNYYSLYAAYDPTNGSVSLGNIYWSQHAGGETGKFLTKKFFR